MTLPRLAAFYKHWAESPPAHVSIAAYLGVGKQTKGHSAAEEAEFDSMMSGTPAFNPAGGLGG